MRPLCFTNELQLSWVCETNPIHRPTRPFLLSPLSRATARATQSPTTNIQSTIYNIQPPGPIYRATRWNYPLPAEKYRDCRLRACLTAIFGPGDTGRRGFHAGLLFGLSGLGSFFILITQHDCREICAAGRKLLILSNENYLSLPIRRGGRHYENTEVTRRDCDAHCNACNRRPVGRRCRWKQGM